MGTKFEGLEPKKVFEWFEKLTDIPRGSGNESAVADLLVDFAGSRGLIAYRDEADNVTILKPATAGMEERDSVILQAHMDMVCVKDDDTDVDMAKDPIDAYVDGDYIKARGTSLGADDGIGVALILAVLDSDDISHPMIEAIFTSDEEVGLGGANGYDVSRLKGKRFINIDTEEENHIVVGCAGGCRCNLSSRCKNGKTEGTIYEIGISGLAGGHSGTDIDKGRANANVLMGRMLLYALQSSEFNIGTYEGGTKDNAICCAASATVVVKKKNGKAFEKAVRSFSDSIASEYERTDPGLVVKCKDKGKGKLEVMSTKDTSKFISLLCTLPNGVEKMSQIYDMVETSSNIGVAYAKPKSFNICVSLRSNRNVPLEVMISSIKSMAAAFNVEFATAGRYPAWEGDAGSELAVKAEEVYRKLFGKEIEKVTIHAGLECAVFSKKLKETDIISIGPDITSAHSTAEKLSISSTGREWEFLQELLKL
ncbi:MAG: beta-Ala-His dipeptidase [Lachnospiraceae bacterium]|nr:beta-Ala-His dipeptidase [Lachnospiraceae bacterium]